MLFKDLVGSVLSENFNRMKVSPTIAATAKVRELKAQGKDILDLGIGEPDFNTPDHIKQAAIDAINNNDTKYPPLTGTPALKKAIQNKFKKDYSLEVTLDQIIVSTGAKQSLFNAFLAGSNENDEVIIPAPYWVSYVDMVMWANGKPVIAPCQENFKITPELLEQYISPKSKWIIINSPSNPSGAVYSAEELYALGEVIKKYPHIWIMVDDIYENIRYNSYKPYTFASVCPHLAERTITINGASKMYSMTGWRIGYAVGPKSMIEAMGILQSHSTTGACSISQAAFAKALESDLSFLDERNKVFKARQDMLIKSINEINGLNCTSPDGAFYLFINCEGLIGKTTAKGYKINSDTDLAYAMLEEAHVNLFPGSIFGYSPYLRISYATSENVLKEAVDRIKGFVNSLN